MNKPSRPCKIIADGGLLTPCKNCGLYHGMNEGVKPKPELDFSQESPRTRQFLLDTINKNLPTIEKWITDAKSERERRSYARLMRRYAELKKAVEDANE